MGRRSRFVLDGVVVAHQPGAILRTDRLGVHRFVRVDGAAAPAPVRVILRTARHGGRRCVRVGGLPHRAGPVSSCGRLVASACG